MCRTAGLPPGAGSCTAHSAGHRWYAGSRQRSIGKLWMGPGQGEGSAHTYPLPAYPRPSPTLTDTVREAVEARAAFLAGGARVAGAAAT